MGKGLSSIGGIFASTRLDRVIERVPSAHVRWWLNQLARFLPGRVEIGYLNGWTRGEDPGGPGGVEIGWRARGCGFGCLTFSTGEDGRELKVDTECMGPLFRYAVLLALARQAKVTG